MYRLRVLGESHKDNENSIWGNLLDYVESKVKDTVSQPDNVCNAVNEILKEYNANNEFGPFLDFESEEDAIAFKLRFG